jgi:hypothetical protein
LPYSQIIGNSTFAHPENKDLPDFHQFFNLPPPDFRPEIPGPRRKPVRIELKRIASIRFWIGSVIFPQIAEIPKLVPIPI